MQGTQGPAPESFERMGMAELSAGRRISLRRRNESSQCSNVGPAAKEVPINGLPSTRSPVFLET
jgi:hypothetical protein